ncbi:hypothetical protein Ares1_0028 [Vibrio phage Ares1]|nr:hypothetical protein Ares1_0028 [Vibrio phage Ares1]
MTRSAGRAHLQRYPSTDQGTLGVLILPDGTKISTIELPDRDNKTSISRIPAGLYKVTPWKSKKFGNVWHLNDVNGRSYILIHKGNVAGDKALGYKTHSAGCILIGMSFGILWGQLAVLNSAKALRVCHEVLDQYSTFELTVEDF